MEIRLYKDFVKRINSTKQPPATSGSYDTKTVRLKEETSLMHPTFILSNFDPRYNYIHVPYWNRYYFVKDVVLNVEGVFEISCDLDPLATYKDSIGATTTYIERTSDLSKVSPFVHDGAISSESKIVSTESAVTNAFPSSTVYILRVMGRGSTNGIGTFVVTYNDIKNIFSGYWGAVDDGSITDYIEALINLYINDPAQYIVGVYRSPIGITDYNDNGSDEVIYMGGHETNLHGIRINNPNTIIFNPHLNKPANMYSDFRAYDPAFSSYNMYLPTVGNVSLPAEIMHMDLQIICCADLFCGDLTFMLYADGDLISTYTSNCYASVSVGVQNGSSGGSLMANALGVGASIATGNVLATVPGLIAGEQRIISPPASVLGTQGSLGAIETYPDIIITCSQKSSTDYPTGVYGRPCAKNLQISTMSGYIKCQNASISNIAGTDEEKNLVNGLLNGGFYYE